MHISHTERRSASTSNSVHNRLANVLLHGAEVCHEGVLLSPDSYLRLPLDTSSRFDSALMPTNTLQGKACLLREYRVQYSWSPHKAGTEKTGRPRMEMIFCGDACSLSKRSSGNCRR